MDKKEEKAQKKAQKQAEKAQRKAERAEQEAKDREMAGREIASEIWGLKTIKVFQNGYVVVGGAFGSPVYEKLLSFEIYDGNVQKKSGFGRGVGAAFTAGANLAFSNMRGDIIVTIVTDKAVHSDKLNATPGTVKTAEKLRASLTAALDSGGASPSKETTKAETDLSDALEKLVALRDSGVLTEEEFEKAKAKLLS